MAAAAQPAPPPPPATATPAPAANRWVVEDTGPTCTMTRRLDAMPERTLVVHSYAGSGSYDVALVSSQGRRAGGGDRDTARLTFDTGASYERSQRFVPRGGREGHVLRFTLPESFLESLARASTFTLLLNDDAVGAYPLPLAGAAVRAFAGCEAGILVDWSADPAGFEPGAVRPRPLGESDRWVGMRELTGAGSNATRLKAVMRLNLGFDGRPTECAVIESSPGPELGTRACSALMERARYEPARGPNGNPVRSVVTYVTEAIRVTTFQTQPIR